MSDNIPKSNPMIKPPFIPAPLAVREPIRYTQKVKCVEPSHYVQQICSGMVESAIGEWVLHSEYAHLKAEIERIKTHTFTTNELASMKAETELLNAKFNRDLLNKALEQVERLQKTGDEMAFHIGNDYESQLKCVDEWRAVRDFKPLAGQDGWRGVVPHPQEGEVQS